MLHSAAQVELDQLLALAQFQQTSGWLDRDDLDDQGRFLALAYTMQLMGARYMVDVHASVHPRLRPDTPGQSGLGSFWVYGLEIVDDAGGRAFVGVNAERSRHEAEVSVVHRDAPGAPPWTAPRWEEKGSVFQSLEHARKFYGHQVYMSLERLAGEGRAHLQALVLRGPADLPPAHINRL